MKSIVCVAALLCAHTFGTSSALARLGETVAEIETRYGKPVQVLPSKTDERRIYRQDDVELDVLFVAGKSLRETVHRPGKDKQLGPEECLSWAKKLSGKDDWELQFGNGNSASWISGKLMAAKSRRQEDGSDYFSVYGEGFMAYFQTKQDAQMKAEMKSDEKPASTNSTRQPTSEPPKSN